MTVTATLPTPPEPYLEPGLVPAEFYAREELLSETDWDKINRLRDFSRTKVVPIVDNYWAEFPQQLPAWQPTMIATPDTVHGSAGRHRVVAIGSGFGALTATKALKHAQVNITDALVFLTRITAQGTSHVLNQMPIWVQFIPATAAAATTMGVLIALYVAVVREPKKAAEERRHLKAQMYALRRAERQRVAAQARKVVLSCVRTPLFCESWRTVRINNASNALTAILIGDVKSIAANGSEVTDGCRQANNTMPVDQWQPADTKQPKRADKQPAMSATADDIVTAASDFRWHECLQRSRRTSKGWF